MPQIKSPERTSGFGRSCNPRSARPSQQGGDPLTVSPAIARPDEAPNEVPFYIVAKAATARPRRTLKQNDTFAVIDNHGDIGVALGEPDGIFNNDTRYLSRLELLIDAVPGTRRVAVLWSPLLLENVPILESIRRSASARGIEVFSRELRGEGDLSPAFDDATRAGAQAAVFVTDNVMFGHRKQVAELALAHRLPTIHSFRLEAVDGGMMFYGPSGEDTYGRVAALADRILKGARPSELPVEQPTKFELVINLRTAKALGLTIPESFLLRADEVIE